MAKLNFLEKQCFENLFDMSSGYILNFSNRTFQEFVGEIMGFDIYQKYPALSKAKILREIMESCDNIPVGKLLLELLNYMQYQNMITADNKSLFSQCVGIGNRLIGKQTATVKTKTQVDNKPSNPDIDYSAFVNKLTQLTNYIDSPQARGFEFERYLKELFGASGLDPRGSFKIIGEQIDGSFILHKEVYLLEAKWTNKKTDKSDLVIFNEKVSSKSGFTRGVFISFSGFTDGAIDTFASGRSVNIILMTVQELSIMLSRKISLNHLLWCKVRALAEEGNFNKSIFDI